MPRSSSVFNSLPTSPSCSIMPSAYSLSGMPLWPRIDGRTCVRRCIRGIHPDEERHSGMRLTLDKIDCGTGGLVVDRFHALYGQRSGVFDLLFANLAEARIGGRVVGLGGGALQYTSRAEPCGKSGILGIIRILRILFGIQVVEIAEEFVEAMYRRQEFIPISKMVLAELTGG